MEYNYKVLREAKDSVEAELSGLADTRVDVLYEKYKELEEKFLKDYLPTYLEFVYLVDTPFFVDENGRTSHSYITKDSVHMCIDDTWVRSKYYIGILNVYGSCGDHMDSLFLDTRLSASGDHVIWRWKNGTADRYDGTTVTSAPKHRAKLEALKMMITILRSVIEEFEEFKSQILKQYVKEMQEKQQKVEKLKEEIKEYEKF